MRVNNPTGLVLAMALSLLAAPTSTSAEEAETSPPPDAERHVGLGFNIGALSFGLNTYTPSRPTANFLGGVTAEYLIGNRGPVGLLVRVDLHYLDYDHVRSDDPSTLVYNILVAPTADLRYRVHGSWSVFLSLGVTWWIEIFTPHAPVDSDLPNPFVLPIMPTAGLGFSYDVGRFRFSVVPVTALLQPYSRPPFFTATASISWLL